jgi:hypothetical protein
MRNSSSNVSGRAFTLPVTMITYLFYTRFVTGSEPVSAWSELGRAGSHIGGTRCG